MHRRDFVKKSIIASAGLDADYWEKKEAGKIKTVILGFNGANWVTIDPLIEEGELPFLKKLKEESTGPNFGTFKTAKFNVVWAIISSGKTILKNGIPGCVYQKKSGIKVPYTNANRKEPKIWQTIDSSGEHCTVTNRYCFHPPGKIKGIMVSDHFRRIVRKRVKRDESYDRDLRGLKSLRYI